MVDVVVHLPVAVIDSEIFAATDRRDHQALFATTAVALAVLRVFPVPTFPVLIFVFRLILVQQIVHSLLFLDFVASQTQIHLLFVAADYYLVQSALAQIAVEFLQAHFVPMSFVAGFVGIDYPETDYSVIHYPATDLVADHSLGVDFASVVSVALLAFD